MTVLPDLPLPDVPTGQVELDAAIRSLGFDPVLVQAVILTPTSAVAIAVDYPEPYTPPEA